MKQLFIIRHAKSSWDYTSLNDFDRPLNERGKHDAPLMAKRLLRKQITIDAFVSSTANRALTTATYFAETFGANTKSIFQIEELYHAPASLFYTIIQNLNNQFSSVALFSHNPGITQFVNQLTTARLDNMPTCGVFAIQCKIKSWKHFSANNNQFWFFDYPKNSIH